ncbi:MAG: hypothetical protein M1409_01575 [Actinobacteria bacterium]|nr:hypothetical protein [Actinomycetota bacterium]
MKINEFDNIRKLYFSYQDVAKALNISEKASMVTCVRYVKSGILLRLKRNLYMKKEKWKYVSVPEIYEISNLIQTPSYISLTTAIYYYGMTTQVQQDYFESIALKRSVSFEIQERTFNYSKIKKELYSGFTKNEDFFIALPEKAILDALYLQFLGRYKLDLSAIDFDKVDLIALEKKSEIFPSSFKNYVKRVLRT